MSSCDFTLIVVSAVNVLFLVSWRLAAREADHYRGAYQRLFELLKREAT